MWVLNSNTGDGQSANFGTGTLYFGALAGFGQFRQDTAGTSTLEIGALNQDTTFSGIIYQANGSDIFSVSKVGTGTLTLTGGNSYTGLTAVKQGRLLINQAFTGNGGFAVSNSATLGLTNDYSATPAAVGALTLAVGAILEFQSVSNPAIALATATSVTLNGVGTVLITGTNYLVAGKTYPLFNYTGAFTGAFTNLQLQMPYGWRGTLLNSGSQVSLANVAIVSTVSPPLSLNHNGSQLQLSWPSTNTGWRLLMNTNLAGTNWLGVSGSSATNLILLSPTNGSMYYRMVYP
jgi:autotransporter-associated beta strand protein